MITKEMRMAATEINQILRYTDDVDVSKIPLGLRLFFKEIADNNYIPDINPEKSLDDHKLMSDTKDILAMIYCYYWSTEEELESIPNEVKNEAEAASIKYLSNYSSTDFIESKKEEKSLSNVTKEPWYKRIFRWFKKA
jgi:hypothetical protein